jgi:hypothetical protein
MYRYKLKAEIISAFQNNEMAAINVATSEIIRHLIDSGQIYYTSTFKFDDLPTDLSMRSFNTYFPIPYTMENGNDSRFSMPKSWVSYTTDLPAGQIWSETKYRTVNFSGDHLLDQVRVRYAFYDRPISGLMNVVMDNYMPKILYNARFNSNNLFNLKLPKTIYCISPWFADVIGARQIETEQLCRVLGYTVKDLKQLITKVKANNYSITFVGYGGTGVNTIHWLTEIMKFTNSVNLFKFVEIVEPESLEISNLLRFPKHPNKVSNNSVITQYNMKPSAKLRLLDKSEVTLLSKNKPHLLQSYLDNASRDYGMQGLVYDYDLNRRNSTNVYKAKDNHVFYGAPSLGTRGVMGQWGNFIAATHSGNGCQMWLNPTQDTDLQIESYGLISLTQFFMNQLRMAISLLEILAAKTDLSQVDTQLLEYAFDGVSKLATDRSYNFQLPEHSGNVATEQEAATTF